MMDIMNNMRRIVRNILFVLMCLMTIGVSAAQVDSTFETGVLDNGLTYYVKQNALPENTIEFRLAFKAGSILETEAQKGLAHFCEHMAFNGTEHFEGNSVIKYLESVGVAFGSNLNASTGFDRTIYQFSLPYKDEAGLDSAYMIFSDWVKGLRFEHDDIDAERGVIMSEWRTSQGAKNRFRELIIPKLYYNSRYAERLPIGDTAVIKGFDYDEIKAFYKSWYRPDMTAIIVSGDIDKDLAVAKVREWFEPIPMPEEYKERPYYSIPKQDSTFILRYADPEETTSGISVMIKEDNVLSYEDKDVRRELVEYLFVKILNTRLLELSKSADSPFLRASVSGLSVMTHTTATKSISIVPQAQDYVTAIEAFRQELDRMSLYGALPAEIERSKEALLKAQERSVIGASKRKSASYAEEYIRNFLFGNPITSAQEDLEMFQRLFTTITNDDIIAEAASWYNADNRIILIETPEKYAAAIPSDELLLQSFDKAIDSTLEAYVEEDYSQPFFTDQLNEAAIVDSSYNTALDITSWTLDNGVKIILKPTDYSDDHIQFRAFSPGGHSLLSDDDFFAASKMHNYLSGVGYGDFSKAMLRKKVNGKKAKVVAAVNQYDEGLVGSSDHDGLELMLQYVYMHFTHPREDSLAFENYKKKLLMTYKDADLNPSYVFGDTLQRVLYQGHTRKFVFPDMAWLDQMSVEQMSRIKEERFADASDFTFVFVGDYDIDSIRPALVSYLGNLPGNGKHEKAAGLKIKALKKAEVFTYEIGKTDNVAKVSMRFNAKSKARLGEQQKVTAAASILNMRLLAELREKEGAVYSVSAKGAVSGQPFPEFQGGIYFTCKPEDVDKLVNMSQQIIKDLAQNGPTAEELENVRGIEREKRLKYEESNLFWVRSLKTYTENAWPLDELENGVERIENVDAKDVISVIKHCYKNAKVFVLAPEK